MMHLQWFSISDLLYINNVLIRPPADRGPLNAHKPQHPQRLTFCLSPLHEISYRRERIDNPRQILTSCARLMTGTRLVTSGTVSDDRLQYI